MEGIFCKQKYNTLYYIVGLVCGVFIVLFFSQLLFLRFISAKLARKETHRLVCLFAAFGHLEGGFERRLLATCRWHAATAVAFPQKSESVLSHSQKRLISAIIKKR